MRKTASKKPAAAPTGSRAKRPPAQDPDRPLPLPGASKAPPSRHYTPWLVLRSEAGDVGERPLASGVVFWESPDVWTEGSLGINQPVVGEPTAVFARISNLGLQDATGVMVKYWWADPSLTITEQTAHLIGATTVSILSNYSLVFKCPTDWVPIFENSGHECLLVEAFIPAFDPLTEPMQPVSDRHVGQKNETLVMLPLHATFQFHLEAYNFTAEKQHVTIEARRGAIPRDFAKRFAGKARWPAELLDPVRTLPVEIGVSRETVRIAAGSRAGSSRVFAEAAREGQHVKNSCLGPAQASQTHVFRPGEIRRVTINGALPSTAHLGEIHAIRITQRIGRVVTGGYTLYLTLDAR
jgi:hypothetical protein